MVDIPIPLTEDILATKQSFFRTFLDQLLIEGRIIKIALNVDTANAYVVPAKHKFYLVALNCFVTDRVGTTTNPSGWQFTEAGNVFDICSVILGTSGTNGMRNVFPAIPIEFEEGVGFDFLVATNLDASGFIYGIEVKKEIAFL